MLICGYEFGAAAQQSGARGAEPRDSVQLTKVKKRTKQPKKGNKPATGNHGKPKSRHASIQ